jgi:putative DNA primase/helicase
LLTDDGHKAPLDYAKPLLKDAKVIPGSAIRLAQPQGKTLGVAEGVETALAATQLHGLPTWAVTGERLLRQFVPPPGVEKIVVFGDHDSSGVGQKAAHTLATRLKAEGLEAEVRIPDKVGDWNDVLLEGLCVHKTVTA